MTIYKVSEKEQFNYKIGRKFKMNSIRFTSNEVFYWFIILYNDRDRCSGR